MEQSSVPIIPMVPSITAAPVEIFSFAMDSPDDISGLREKLGNQIQFTDILAIFIKSEGNGLDNDFSRLLAARVVKDLFSEHPLPMLIISGGCEGFTTPHMLIVVARRLPAASSGESSWLVAARVRSPHLDSKEIGTSLHIEHCASAILLGIESLGVSREAVAYVHAVTPMTEQAHASKPVSRAATALACAVAIDGIEDQKATQALQDNDMTIHGSRCAVTAGNTGGSVDLLIFANVDRDTAIKLDQGSAGVTSQQQLHCVTLPDSLDTTPLQEHLQVRLSPHRSTHRKLVALLYKADPPLHGKLRGERLTIDHDSDIHAYRHYRAAMSGVLAGATGSTRIFIGGGAEHHCPPDSGLLTVVTETADHSAQSNKGA